MPEDRGFNRMMDRLEKLVKSGAVSDEPLTFEPGQDPEGHEGEKMVPRAEADKLLVKAGLDPAKFREEFQHG